MKNQTKAYLFALFTILCWSTVSTATKLSLQYSTPLSLVFYASWTSFFVLAAALYMQKKISLLKNLSLKDWLMSLLFGAINPVLYYIVLFRAYELLPAQQCQVINYTWAITMTLLSIPLLGHKVSRKEWFAIAVSYCGVLIIATKGEVFSLHFENPKGVLLALVSTLLWALYWILNTRETRDEIAALFANFCCALPILTLYILWQKGYGELAVDWRGIAGGIYLGLFEMGVSFICWLTAMKYTDNTAKIASLIFVAPILSLFFIALILHEAIHPSTIIGLIFVLGGLLLQKSKKKNTEK